MRSRSTFILVFLTLGAFLVSARPIFYISSDHYYDGGKMITTHKMEVAGEPDNPYGPMELPTGPSIWNPPPPGARLHPPVVRRDGSTLAKRERPIAPYRPVVEAYKWLNDGFFHLTRQIPYLDAKVRPQEIYGCQYHPSQDGLEKDLIVCPAGARDGEQDIPSQDIPTVIIPRDDNTTQEIVQHVGDGVVSAVEAGVEIIGDILIGGRSETNVKNTACSDGEKKLSKRSVTGKTSAVVPREDMEPGDKAAAVANGTAGAVSIAIHVLGSMFAIGKRYWIVPQPDQFTEGLLPRPKPKIIMVDPPRVQSIEKRHRGTGGTPHLHDDPMAYYDEVCNFVQNPHDHENRAIKRQDEALVPMLRPPTIGTNGLSSLIQVVVASLNWKPAEVTLVVDPGANVDDGEVNDPVQDDPYNDTQPALRTGY